MLFRNPRALPTLLICIGLGLVVYRGWQLHNMPSWTAQEIEQSVELNYTLDLARSRSSAMDPIPVLPPDEERRRKDAIRAEITNETATVRGTAENELQQGILLLSVGIILYFGVLFMERSGRFSRG